MSLAYQIMYRFGATPWEHREPPVPLADLIEGPRALPPGDMLDIGCGTGHDAIYCARHGWTVTGVDAVGRALRAARLNAGQAGADIRFLHADIASPGTTELGARRLHSSDRQNVGYAAAGSVSMPTCRNSICMPMRRFS